MPHHKKMSYVIKKGTYSLTNKDFAVYESDRSYSTYELGRFLKNFRLDLSLVTMGKMLKEKKFWSKKLNIPIDEFLFAYLIMKFIENPKANDLKSKTMTPENVREACNIYFGLPEPESKSEKDFVYECLIRFGMSQLDFQRTTFTLIQRTILIYKELWVKCEKTKEIDIEKAFIELYDLTVEELLIIGFSILAFSKECSFKIFEPNSEKYNNFSEKFKKTLSIENQEKFLNLFSCNYEEFRVLSQENLIKLTDVKYEKYRFNTLLLYPIVSTEYKNIKKYIVPIPLLIFERITRGLYHDLSNKFNLGKKGNKFKKSFGHVFEDYVRTILEKTLDLKEYKIIPEWEYSNKRGITKDSVDLIVIKSNKAIFIEIKQSALYKSSKETGVIPDELLNQTISKAVKQLWIFENDLKSGNFPKLSLLSNIIEIERLVLTYDSIYFSNDILRTKVKESLKTENSNVPQKYHWHTISIDEFENFINIGKKNLFKLLEDKKKENDSSDFRDYFSRNYPEYFKKEKKNDFFDNLYIDFFDSFGLKEILPGLNKLNGNII